MSEKCAFCDTLIADKRCICKACAYAILRSSFALPEMKESILDDIKWYYFLDEIKGDEDE